MNPSKATLFEVKTKYDIIPHHRYVVVTQIHEDGADPFVEVMEYERLMDEVTGNNMEKETPDSALIGWNDMDSCFYLYNIELEDDLEGPEEYKLIKVWDDMSFLEIYRIGEEL